MDRGRRRVSGVGAAGLAAGTGRGGDHARAVARHEALLRHFEAWRDAAAARLHARTLSQQSARVVARRALRAWRGVVVGARAEWRMGVLAEGHARRAALTRGVVRWEAWRTARQRARRVSAATCCRLLRSCACCGLGAVAARQPRVLACAGSGLYYQGLTSPPACAVRDRRCSTQLRRMCGCPAVRRCMRGAEWPWHRPMRAPRAKLRRSVATWWCYAVRWRRGCVTSTTVRQTRTWSMWHSAGSAPPCCGGVWAAGRATWRTADATPRAWMPQRWRVLAFEE